MKKINAVVQEIPELSQTQMELVSSRIDQLIKPVGSLGLLETLAIRLSGIQGTEKPQIGKRAVLVMAGDHGVVEEGVAISPKVITRLQSINMTLGITGVCALAKLHHADVFVHDIGIEGQTECDKIIDMKVRPGTANMAKTSAMTREEAIQCIEAGIEAANKAIDSGYQMLAVGEMGIGNTTPASALTAVFCGVDPLEVTSLGANLPEERLMMKVDVIRKAIALHQPDPSDPIDVLSKVGGLEIGAMAGVMLAAAARRVPVVLDGFISMSSALIAEAIAPQSVNFMIASHRSVEIGSEVASEKLGLMPPLDLGLRLGEGSGAVVMFGVLDASLAMLNDMITFEEAGFSV
jgi:nicotinate-nucleotide--dimethylbenzimidazole phosphoribosyltransferase